MFELGEMFAVIDTRRTRHVTWLQLRKALRENSDVSFGMSAENKTNAIFRELDKDTSEFLLFCFLLSPPPPSPSPLPLLVHHPHAITP